VMARKVFFSFHYEPDNWRAATVRNIGAIEGNKPAKDNDWETVTKGGDKAIEKWIADQMHGRSCVVVLIGSNTAGRKWIKYEIKKSWEAGKGVLGIYIHNLLDAAGKKSVKGDNPFGAFTIDGTSMSSIVKAYNPSGADSKAVYKTISDNIEDWLDKAIEIRGKY
jgi:hypothetical protein